MSLIDLLKTLYLVDQQVRGLESRVNGAKRLVNTQNAKLEQLLIKRDELQDTLKHTQAQATKLEKDSDDLEKKIEHSRRLMNNVKTNKEYSALLVEVNTLKADKSHIENQALEQLANAETLGTELDELLQRIESQQKIKEVAKKEPATRHAEVSPRLEQLKIERDAATTHIPHGPLAVFERLVNNDDDGEALVPIIETDRKRHEYICSGCYIKIPLERVNLLFTQDKLVHCPTCKRILYVEDELKEALQTRD